MPKVVRETPLTTRNARAKLAAQKKPYWRGIDPTVHLGYRKAARGGHWLVRWYVDGCYKQEKLGTADDALDADGVNILDFGQASRRARSVVAERIARTNAEALGPVLTVQDALTAYIATRTAREEEWRGHGSLKSDARSRLTRHVQSKPIASKALYTLTESDLIEWVEAVRAELSAGTVRRLANDFRAALNASYAAHRKKLPAELPMVIRHGLRIEEAPAANAREQVLPDADVRRLISAAWEVDRQEAWDGDLAPMIVVMAATGARFSQIARMNVGDVQPAGRLMMPASRKGKSVKKVDRIAIRVGDDVIAALKPKVAGRKGSAPLFERWRHVQTKRSVWKRDRRGPWRNASELGGPWKTIVATAGIAADIVPYTFRHSSIVRGLRAGLPVKLVASLHDTSVAMIERHYAAYIIDAMDELAARAVVPLTTLPASIIPIAAGAGGKT